MGSGDIGAAWLQPPKFYLEDEISPLVAERQAYLIGNYARHGSISGCATLLLSKTPQEIMLALCHVKLSQLSAVDDGSEMT
ncbi:unnamed protein product [Clavelina lepadiformis]|uniref:Uncharacterized protein n=1 Tax=Clavelina lepadiformis TaxID=159417 RepID=A0ABP0FGT7_CLALP